MKSQDTRRLGRGLGTLIPVPPQPATQLHTIPTQPPSISLDTDAHLERAEAYLDMAEDMGLGTPSRADALAAAQVHATLALVKKGTD